jgi:predicted N-acetyltransferase YhbS
VAAVRIRPLTFGDAAAAASLIREAFAAQSRATDPPPGELAAGGGGGAEIDGALVGVMLWAEKEAALHLGRVCVLPGWRGQGIARALLAAGEAEARRRAIATMTLRVRLTLDENQRLFAAFGFAPVGQGAHRGYSAPTFMVMEKRLD